MPNTLLEVEALRGLSSSAIERLTAAAVEMTLAADSLLFREGDAADALFIIRTGSVRVVQQRPVAGGAMVREHIAAGGVIGEEEVLDGRSRTSSVMADTDCSLWKISRSALRELVATEPLLQAKLAEVRLGRTSDPARYELIPDGEIGIRMVGHRDYVGGLWDSMGQLQLDFLVAQGLKPDHCLLDVACGALRAGVRFIHYLEPGCYLGLDKEQALIDAGIEQELGASAYEAKRPEFVVSGSFEFHKFSKKPHFAIAQSLFTHLNHAAIKTCLRNLRALVEPGHVFFATFTEGDSAANPDGSNSLAGFRYSRREMERLGAQTGWRTTYVGDWRHPRNQMMMKYVAEPRRSLWSWMARLSGGAQKG